MWSVAARRSVDDKVLRWVARSLAPTRAWLWPNYRELALYSSSYVVGRALWSQHFFTKLDWTSLKIQMSPFGQQSLPWKKIGPKSTFFHPCPPAASAAVVKEFHSILSKHGAPWCLLLEIHNPQVKQRNMDRTFCPDNWDVGQTQYFKPPKSVWNSSTFLWPTNDDATTSVKKEFLESYSCRAVGGAKWFVVKV
jgi:hypothetical protein